MKMMKKFKLYNYLLITQSLNKSQKQELLSYNPSLILEANQINLLTVHNLNSFIANFSILNSCKKNATDNDVPNYILRIINYVEENVTKPLSTQEIANYIGYSRPHISREFKRVMKITLKDFIIQSKIEFSLNYIKGKDCKEVEFSELAQKIGMSSYTTFTKNFRKYTNQKPIDYLLYEKSLG